MIFLRFILMVAAVLLSAYLLPGVAIAGIWAAVWVALLLGLVNITLRPLLVVLTLPINIVTLGLFTIVINGALVMLVSSVIKGFSVDGFLSAVVFSLVLSLVSYVSNGIFGINK